MAFLSLVTGVVDSTGERVDLPQTDGTYLPVRIKLGLNLTGTPATNGGQTDITVDAATVSATYAQVQAALATADADLEVGNAYGVAADHFSAGGDPALSGALRTSGGELVMYRDSGTDYAALQGSATLVTLGNSSSDAEVLLGTGKSLSVVVNGTGTQLEVGDVVALYGGTTTHATATGEVGLDASGRLTVWTGGAESSLVAESDALSGDLSGSLGGTPEVVGLRGVGIDATPPALNQVLAYDGTNWKATTPAGGGGGLSELYASSWLSATVTPSSDIAAGGDGVYSINGKSWTAAHTANAAKLVADVNGLTGKATSAGSGYPVLYATTQSLASVDCSTRALLVTMARIRRTTSGANADCSLTLNVGMEAWNTGLDQPTKCGVINLSRNGSGAYVGFGATCNAGGGGGTTWTGAVTDDMVLAVALADGGRHVTLYAGAWGGSWPDLGDLYQLAGYQLGAYNASDIWQPKNLTVAFNWSNSGNTANEFSVGGVRILG